MSLNNDTIKLATNKKFTEFSEKIKQVLKAKLVAHEDISNYKKEFDRIQQMKTSFADITSQDSGE